MFSDSSYDSDDVAVIRQSILEHCDTPFIQSLSSFAKHACGWSGSLKKFQYAKTYGTSFSAIAVCPPIAVAVQECSETREYTSVATGGESLSACQALANQALLTKLHKDGLIDKYSAAPTDRVCLPRMEIRPPGEPTQHIPLYISEAQIASCSLLKMPESHPVVYIHESKQLTDLASDGKDVLLQLLFPDGLSRQTQEGPIVVGFDVEWRPTGAKYRGTHSVSDGESAPVAVVQLSSEAATVVVNVMALGYSLLPKASLREACSAGAAIVQSVFESQKIEKVGLSCQEDLKRLRLTLPQCQFPNTTDLKDLAERVGLQRQGLRALTGATLHKQLGKGNQCSDWQQITLSEEQVKYAALDAYATRHVYLSLLRAKACIDAGNAKRAPHKVVQKTPEGLSELLEAALAAGTVDVDARPSEDPEDDFARTAPEPRTLTSGCGRGRGGYDAVERAGGEQGRGDRGRWGPAGRGVAAERPGSYLGNDCEEAGYERWSHAGRGRGRGGARAAAQDEFMQEEVPAGHFQDMYDGAPQCTQEQGGYADGHRPNSSYLGWHNESGDGRWLGTAEKDWHDDRGGWHGRRGARGMPQGVRAIGESAGCKQRHRGWESHSFSMPFCNLGENDARSGGMGSRCPHGRGRGRGRRGSGGQQASPGIDQQATVWGPGNAGGTSQGRGRLREKADQHRDREEATTSRQQSRTRWRDRDKLGQRVGGGGRVRQRRRLGRLADCKGKPQEAAGDCYTVHPSSHVFDPREVPTSLYVASEKEAHRRFSEEKPPPVVQLAHVKPSEPLPIATPPLSHFDVMQHYFASVEAVSQDATVEWVKAWGIEELKMSPYYKDLLAYFGDTAD